MMLGSGRVSLQRESLPLQHARLLPGLERLGRRLDGALEFFNR